MKTHTKMLSKFLFATFVFGLIATPAYSQGKAIKKSPLMGWASWNNYGVGISESIIKGQADAMVSSGLAAVGFKYINIDDGFFAGRYADGTLKIDSIKFPNGMKNVADYIHSRGLKAGFYSDAGANTCGSVADNQTGGVGGGLYNHDQQDINLFFKNWGFDFLKVDWCGGRILKLDEKTRYTTIKKAIENTGRTDINYNVCRWRFPGVWVTSVADSWRISGDIQAKWNSVMNILNQNAYLAAYASQGHYNDMDMLEVGRGMTAEEDKSHFSMWCILSSPLVLGNDLTKISRQTKNILTNTEVIAVNQDTTGIQAQIVSDNGAGLQVWAKNLNGKQSLERAVVLFNRSNADTTMTLKLSDLNLVGPASVRDIWLHTDLNKINSEYTTKVPSHGVVMLKVIGAKNRLKETFEAEYAWINNFNLTQNNSIVANQGQMKMDYNCSGLAKVVNLGNRADNYIEFREIYANLSGKYRLTITYLCGDNRNATMSVNGKDTLLTGLNSGGNTILKSTSYSVKLNKGYNTIRFSNATGSLPDFDKIQIGLNAVVNGTAPDGYTWCSPDNGSYTLPGRCDVAYGANGMFNYLYTQTGTITFNSATFGDPIPNTSKAGYYKILPDCIATPIIPYLQVNGGTWVKRSDITIKSGDKIKFGPQPSTGGSWSWSGLGTSGTSREQVVTPTSSGIITATFTNECNLKSIQKFNITVE
jgi:Alpha galactosidase A/Alpha galactosidase C-terminal beta sandwich domain